MNPLAPLLVTICLLSPGCFFVLYCSQYVRMARRPDAARVRVCEWFLYWMAGLAVILGAAEVVSHTTRHLQKVGPYLWLGWPVLAAAIIGAFIVRHKLAKKVKKKPAPNRVNP